jgi:hypothetical protein
MVACPRTQDNPTACPLHEIRKRSFAERVAYLDAASADEVEAIATMCDDSPVAHRAGMQAVHLARA